MRPPGIVARLLDVPLQGYAGAIELKSVARRIATDEVADYVKDVLEHHERVLPVVIVAGDAPLQFPPNELARRLAGLAHVAAFEDRATLIELKRVLPRTYVPFAGARIYWPGLGQDEDLVHRYWTKSQLSHGKAIDARLRQLLAPLSVFRVPEDGTIGRIQVSVAREAIQRIREDARRAGERAATEDLSELRTSYDSLSAQYEHLEEETYRGIDRQEQLEAQNGSLRGEVSQLSAELATAQENLKAYFTSYEEQEPEDETEGRREPPDSWGELSERILELLSPGFAITDRAQECSESNHYPSPGRMWDSLEKLAEAGDAFNAAGGETRQRFSDWIHENYGLDVSLQDGSYENHQFEFEGSTLSRLPHVKVDDAVAPSEVGRIYFALDTDNARLVVDWFGVKRDRP